MDSLGIGGRVWSSKSLLVCIWGSINEIVKERNKERWLSLVESVYVVGINPGHRFERGVLTFGTLTIAVKSQSWFWHHVLMTFSCMYERLNHLHTVLGHLQWYYGKIGLLMDKTNFSARSLQGCLFSWEWSDVVMTTAQFNCHTWCIYSGIWTQTYAYKIQVTLLKIVDLERLPSSTLRSSEQRWILERNIRTLTTTAIHTRHFQMTAPNSQILNNNIARREWQQDARSKHRRNDLQRTGAHVGHHYFLGLAAVRLVALMRARLPYKRGAAELLRRLGSQ